MATLRPSYARYRRALQLPSGVSILSPAEAGREVKEAYYAEFQNDIMFLSDIVKSIEDGICL